MSTDRISRQPELTEEIVSTTSEDGFRLEGVQIQSINGSDRPTAIVCIHGSHVNFYLPVYLNLGRKLARQGYTFLSVNTRGHDFGSLLFPQTFKSTTGEAFTTVRLSGSAWERFGEIPFDLAAWVDFVVMRDFEGVVLMGHSLGATKAIYYQAERQDPRVRGVIAASPGRHDVDDRLKTLAEQMVIEGRGEELLPVDEGEPSIWRLSAASYLEEMRIGAHVYKSDQKAPSLGSLRCPLFAFFGTNEPWVGSEADLELIRQNAQSSPRVQTRMFEGGDHSYRGCEQEVATAIADWIDNLLE